MGIKLPSTNILDAVLDPLNRCRFYPAGFYWRALVDEDGHYAFAVAYDDAERDASNRQICDALRLCATAGGRDAFAILQEAWFARR